MKLVFFKRGRWFTPISFLMFSGMTSAALVCAGTGIAHADAKSLQILLRHPEVQKIEPSSRISSELLDTTKFQHYYKGLEVVGSQVLQHSRHSPSPTITIDDQVARFDLDAHPTVLAQDAVSIARSVAHDDFSSASAVLKILPVQNENAANLVYFVRLDGSGPAPGREILVDAHSGQVIADIPDDENLAPSLAPITVYSARSSGVSLGQHVSLAGITSFNQLDPALADQCQLWDDNGNPFWINTQACSLITENPDPQEFRARAMTEKVLNYYSQTFGRNSYDGAGSPLIGTVHAGQNWNNALWNFQKNQMAYGDGDGVTYQDFTTALDVIGHEITHGVTDSTAKLLMMKESGSLNEAYSDFFGRMIANDGDWAIGRALFINQSTARGIRDLSDPSSISFKLASAQGKYPATLSEEFTVPSSGTCNADNDQCYVHINSTIYSHAAYLVYQALGKSMTEKLYYTTLTQKLSATSTFKTAAQATIDTCEMIYNPDACSEVISAFAQVGI
jgi:Zn-dependent metalloprotease